MSVPESLMVTLRIRIVAALALLAVFLIALDFRITLSVDREQSASLRNDLAIRAQILAAQLPDEHASPEHASLDAWVKNAADRAQATITVFDNKSAVLAESGPDATAAGQEYSSIDTPVSNSRIAGIRLAAPLSPVHARTAALFYQLLAVFLAAWLLALFLAYRFLHALSRRIRQLKDYAEHLPDPRGTLQGPAIEHDDLGEVALALQRTGERFRRQVATLELEGARRDTILASMLEGVLAVNKDLRVTFCNESFARAIGARVPVCPGISVLELVRDPALLNILTEALASGGRVERRITLLSAADHSFEVLAGPLAGSPQPGALAILHDVTQLERLERVRKDFVANVSHELRTPLAAIRGYAETLLDGAIEDSENNRKFLEIIMRQAMRLTNIASDLLTLSELESNKGAAQPHPVSVSAALESALRTVEPAAEARGITLKRDSIAELNVNGWELRFEQVFVNLLDNAVKFSRPNGEVVINVEAVDRKARITISDSGVGIPSEDLPRIFERFYRVDKARSRDVGGTGLGLSIVKHVIEQMGGTVTVESRLGEGSRFTILLPALTEPR
jgi:two-component system, OmpR family, phosphate regulon sensor histidine kinase PhoR